MGKRFIKRKTIITQDKKPPLLQISMKGRFGAIR